MVGFFVCLFVLVLVFVLMLLFSLFSGVTVQHVVSYFPDQELNPCPLQGKHGVLTTGWPGKSHQVVF